MGSSGKRKKENGMNRGRGRLATGVECVTPQTKNWKGDNDGSEQTQSGLGLPGKGLPTSETQARLVPADRLIAAAPLQKASSSHFLAERISTVLITSAFFFF